MTKQNGKLTVIAGPMFSGKTGKLVGMVEVFSRMGHAVLTVKPKIDIRYDTHGEIHSHDHRTSRAIIIDRESPEGITAKIVSSGADTVVFDEVQFFDKRKLTAVIARLRKLGIHCIAAGLLYDYRRRPFDSTAALAGLADEYLEMKSVCQKCGNLASHTERVAGNTRRVMVGASDEYIAVCAACHRMFR